MRAVTLLFRPSILFVALGMVVFGSVAALNAGDSSAQTKDCTPDPTTGDVLCAGGGPSPTGTGGSGGVLKQDDTSGSFSGGGGFGTQEDTIQGGGGRLSCNETGECTSAGGERRLDPVGTTAGRCVGDPNDPTAIECTPNGSRQI